MNRAVRIWFFLAAAALMLLSASAASAAAERALTASCPSVSRETVKGRWKKNSVVLSIPGSWDLTKVVLELEGSGTVFLGEGKTEIPAGVPTDLSGFAGVQKVPLWDDRGRRPGNLTIIQGSKIASLFLEVDGEKLKIANRNKDKPITEGRVAWLEADGTVAYDGALEQLKGRGNNSFLYSKKPYQIKLAEKASLGGMGRGKTWVLLAEWTDISLLRNRIVLDMSREIGLRNAVRCVHADVWINGAYQGLYLVTEKIQIGRERIPITNLEKASADADAAPENPGELAAEETESLPLIRYYPAMGDPADITGGYIMTVEKHHRMRDKPFPGFRTADGLNIRIKEPTYPSPAQTKYLAQRVTEMQHALMAENGVAPETGKSYREYLDTESFARKYLIEEWCKNYDVTGGSQYLYKDSDAVDPLIYAGPSWDYDLSFGNMKDRGHGSGGAYVSSFRRTSNLYWLLDKHPEFRERVRELWRTVFRPAVNAFLGEGEAKGPLKSLAEYRAEIEASAAMNAARWGVNGAASGRDAGISFDNAVRYLEKWITARTGWMDEEYGK